MPEILLSMKPKEFRRLATRLAREGGTILSPDQVVSDAGLIFRRRAVSKLKPLLRTVRAHLKAHPRDDKFDIAFALAKEVLTDPATIRSLAAFFQLKRRQSSPPE